MLTAFLCLLLASQAVHGCFLNSCPYRRYGRNVRCATCGVNGDGICATEGICCTSKACTESMACLNAPVCSTRSCEIGKSAGFCVSPTLCCSQASEYCQHNLKCLLATNLPPSVYTV